MILAALALVSAGAWLDGSWLTDCYRRGGADRRDIIEFHEGDVVLHRVYFNDLACASPSFEYVVSGAYALGAPGSGPGGASTLDVTVRSADIVLYDPWLAMAFRDERYCGHAYWAIGEPLPLLGDICGDEKEPEFYDGQVRHDLVNVDTSSHVPRLYFGDPSGLFSDGPPSDRATRVDSDRVFHKDVP
jgi:hypothetical protein